MSENITRGLLIGGQEVAAAGGGVTADISPWTGSRTRRSPRELRLT
jgi:hypothetical protein